MARTRNLSPKVFTDDELGELSPLARLFFLALWPQADREGRLEERWARLKRNTLPFDDVTPEQVLEPLIEAGFVVRYAAPDGRNLLQIRSFHKYQSPHKKEPPSVLPPPPISVVLAQAAAMAPEPAPIYGECRHLRMTKDDAAELRNWFREHKLDGLFPFAIEVADQWLGKNTKAARAARLSHSPDLLKETFVLTQAKKRKELLGAPAGVDSPVRPERRVFSARRPVTKPKQNEGDKHVNQATA
jgi:hypothetical protein